MNIQGLMRAARTNLPILVLEGCYVCLLEELSWISDARWKGGAAAPLLTFNPPSSARRPGAPSVGRLGLCELLRTAAWRRRGHGTEGNWRPSPPCLFNPKAERSPAPQPRHRWWPGDRRLKGDSPLGRAEPCCKHAASSRPAQISRLGSGHRDTTTPPDSGRQRVSGYPREQVLSVGAHR